MASTSEDWIVKTKIDDNQWRFDVMDGYVKDQINYTYYIEREGDDEWMLIDEWGKEFGIVSFEGVISSIEYEEGYRASRQGDDY